MGIDVSPLVAELGDAPRALVPAFRQDEILEVHRTLPDGRRVIMIVKADAASSLQPHLMQLRARVSTYGVSAHADGRVQRQADSIERLLQHLKIHCNDPGNCEEFRATQGEGTDGNTTDNAAAAPQHHQV